MCQHGIHLKPLMVNEQVLQATAIQMLLFVGARYTLRALRDTLSK